MTRPALLPRRRAGVTLVVALAAVLPGPVPGPAEATPTGHPAARAASSFALPMDAGTRAVADAAAARRAIDDVGPRLAPARARRDELQVRFDALGDHLATLLDHLAAADDLVGAARRDVAATAADAYVQAGRVRTGLGLQTFTATGDVLGATRGLLLVESQGARVVAQLEGLLEARRRVAEQVDQVDAERGRVHAALDGANREANRLQGELERARAQLAAAEAAIARFHRLATTAASPIMGPSLLSAREMADFVLASGNTPRLTVGLESLATIFLEESAKVGVRGDVAWAQSILETGWFTFRASMVEPEDNNFAGVGACDSCRRGYQFPDARTGVRAQVQLLRIYVDRTIGRGDLPDEILLPGSLRLGFRGKVQSWDDLTGRWATASDYGTRIYQLYARMVASAGRR